MKHECVTTPELEALRKVAIPEIERMQDALKEKMMNNGLVIMRLSDYETAFEASMNIAEVLGHKPERFGLGGRRVE